MTDSRTLKRTSAAALLGAAALLAGACGRAALNVGRVIPGIADDSVAVHLVLVGDAGLPAPGGEPVMKALRADLAENPDRSFVVYLGDNIYPRGLVDSTGAERRENERILNEQMAPLLETNTRGVFVPGNHDWAAGTQGGWEAIRRQAAYINARGRGLVRMLPEGGCPGPVSLDFGDVLRLIVIDSQWWIHPPEPRPFGATAGHCRTKTEDEVVDSLRVDLASAGTKRTVVVAHHPIVSGGEHGGYFDWPTYLFPFHPWARLGGLFAKQDVSGRNYRALRQGMERAFLVSRPLVYAAGHEHNLQVLRRVPPGEEHGFPAEYLVVSGGGIYNHTTAVRAITGTRYARRASGYVILSFLVDGRVRLSVQVVDAEGAAREDYSAWLVDTPRPRAVPVAASPAPAASPTTPTRP